MLKAIVVLVLSGLWAVVLVPPAWRSLSRLTRSGDSIGTFSRKMSLLGGQSGSTLDLTDAAPRPRAGRPATTTVRPSARKRRRDVLVGLLAANGFTFLLAIVAGGVFWMLWLVSAALLGGYVTLLVQLRKAAVEREMKVAFFPQQSSGAGDLATVRPLRRVGS